MSLNKEEILNAIAEMSVLDLSQLIKDMEEKFGVSASTTLTSPPPEGGGDVNTVSVEEKNEFDVVLTDFKDKKVSVIKAVRKITGLGLKEAKDMVEGVPAVIKESVSKVDAEQMSKLIEEAGGTIELK